MPSLRSLAITASAGLGLPRLFGPNGATATAVLSHRYFTPEEPKIRSIDRLRRQLEWLRTAYVPLDVSELLRMLAAGNMPDRAIIVTTDDALLDIYEVANEFKDFGVPLAVYVCVGWVAKDDKSTDDWLAQATSAVQWYDGPDTNIELANGSRFELSDGRKSINIDRMLSERELLSPYLEELCFRIDLLKGRTSLRSICNWSELRELASAGVHIGAHSVTHVPVSRMSPLRQQYEIFESKRLLERLVGPCTSFAYPYGTWDTHSRSTLAKVKEAGFQGAFVTEPDFVAVSSERYELPRITLPDSPMSLYEFKARVSGGGLPLQRLRNLVRKPDPINGR